jgi:glutaredoxin-dependent peroxiredoxin
MKHVAKIESHLLPGKTICGGAGGGSTSPVFPRDPRGEAQLPHFSPMPIAVGSKAPDFTLKTKTADGLKDVKLSDNFGKKQTVLLFFPAAFTGVCTQEMCDQTSGLAEYEKLGAQVYAISVDNVHSQDAWAKQNKIGLTLLSDLNKTVTKAYDVLFPMLGGIGDTSARAAFVIGQDGVVKYAEQTPTPKELPNFAAIKAALAK